MFDSNFLCAACDKHWEQHETFFETEDERRQNGLPVGKWYKYKRKLKGNAVDKIVPILAIG